MIRTRWWAGLADRPVGCHRRPAAHAHALRIAVAVGAGLALGAAPYAPAQAAFPGHNGRIAYWTTIFDDQSPDEGRNEIFTIRADGTGRHRLTTRGENDSPRWAPFGHRIAYVHRTADAARIWVMDGHGAHQQRLTGLRHHSDTAPAWAPGEGRIVFVRFEHRNQDLMIYSFRTHRATPLHVGDGFNRIPDSPAWSPDGRTIVFSAAHKSETPDPSGNDEPQSELFTVRADGTGLTQITDTPHWFEETPDWSPDGQRLVYRRAGGPNFCEQVDTIDPDGTNRVRLHAGCSATGPVWSPDGRRILTNAVLRNRGGLWTMSATGTDKRFVAGGGGGDWQPLRRCGHGSWPPSDQSVGAPTTQRK